MKDSIDIKILNMLQENGRVKRNVIAEAVGLSLPSLSERMKKLEENGFIEGYFAKVNKKKFDYDIMVFVQVFIDSSKNYLNFTEKVTNEPNILECHSVLGEGSHILKIVARDTKSLESILAKIQSWKGVNHTLTNFVLSSIKETTKLKIEE